ncbi:uncharacterized mitochondrial protein-like protein [Tanacetum coccineum]
MTEPTMEEYMTKTREDYGSGVARSKFDKDVKFELKGQFLKELRDNTFSGSENEDPIEHIERVLEIVDLFTTPDVTQDQFMLRVFPISLTGAASRWLRNEPAGSITTWEILKGKFLSKYCPPSRLDVPIRHILDSKGGVPTMKADDAKKAIQEMAAQLNNLGREIKKVNERVYAAQVGCELCGGPHYSKDCPLKEEGKTLEEAYYTQFGVPFPNAGRYTTVALGFYQRDNGNPSYQKRRQTMEESLSKFMEESAKRHDKNSSLIMEI